MVVVIQGWLKSLRIIRLFQQPLYPTRRANIIGLNHSVFFNVLRVSCCGNYISLSKKYVKYIPRSNKLNFRTLKHRFYFYIFIRAGRGTKTYRNRQSYCMYSSQKAQTKSKASNTLYNTTIVSFREKIPRETVSVNRWKGWIF